MHRRYVGILKYGLFASAIAMLPLAGCTMADYAGTSAFGGSKMRVAELPENATYTADGALTEARSHFRNNNFGYSAAYYKRVVELAPQNVEAYFGLGASYDRLGRFDLADRVYASIYKLSGATAQYYNNVGYSYMLRGNLKAALTNFRKASKLDPDNLVIANNIQLLSNAAAASRA